MKSSQALREGHGLLGGDGVTYVRDFEHSTLLATKSESSVIIASSGMCDAGRIQQHLKQLVDDPRCAIILVSFQASGHGGSEAAGTKADGSVSGPRLEQVDQRAPSGRLQRPRGQGRLPGVLDSAGGKVGKVRLIHGEHEQADALAETLRGVGFADVSVPGPGDRAVLG